MRTVALVQWIGVGVVAAIDAARRVVHLVRLAAMRTVVVATEMGRRATVAMMTVALSVVVRQTGQPLLVNIVVRRQLPAPSGSMIL